MMKVNGMDGPEQVIATISWDQDRWRDLCERQNLDEVVGECL